MGRSKARKKYSVEYILGITDNWKEFDSTNNAEELVYIVERLYTEYHSQKIGYRIIKLIHESTKER